MQVRVCLLTVLVTGPATLTLVLRICHFQPRWQRVLQVLDPTPQFWDVGFQWCHYSARISASPGVQQQEEVPGFQSETHAPLFSPALTTARATATKTTTVSLSHGGTHHPLSCPVHIGLGTIPSAQAVPQTPLSPHPDPGCHCHPLWGQSAPSHAGKELLWLWHNFRRCQQAPAQSSHEEAVGHLGTPRPWFWGAGTGYLPGAGGSCRQGC